MFGIVDGDDELIACCELFAGDVDSDGRLWSELTVLGTGLRSTLGEVDPYG